MSSVPATIARRRSPDACAALGFALGTISTIA